MSAAVCQMNRTAISHRCSTNRTFLQLSSPRERERERREWERERERTRVVERDNEVERTPTRRGNLKEKNTYFAFTKR